MVKIYMSKVDLIKSIRLNDENKTNYLVNEINCNEKYYYLVFLMFQYIKSHYRNSKDNIEVLNIIDIYDSANNSINIDYVGGDEFIKNLITYTIEFSKNI